MKRAPSVGEALSQFREANGIPCDSAATWSCRLGPLRLCLPNFRWRRRVIARHDLHHVLTGYPCTLHGECQMAAWEFAAGRFPHPAATLFCLPLIAVGVAWSPRAIWAAFLAGRGGRSLYGVEVTEAFLAAPLEDLRSVHAGAGIRRATLADGLAFVFLLVRAALLLLVPTALIASAILLG